MATDPRRRPMPPPPPPPPPPLEASQNDAQRRSSPAVVDGSDDRPSSRPQSTQPASQTGTPMTRDETPDEGDGGSGGGFRLKFCTVCASNNNRSMEAHLRLTTSPNPYPTLSFGTGSLVRLPGPSISQPNVYHFNSTSYRAMYDELASKDPRLYRANGILPMLERNKGVKWGPERWQDWKVGVPRVGRRWHAPDSGGIQGDGGGGGGGATEADADFSADKGSEGTEGGSVDVVITCEERCWEAVVDDLLNRGGPLNRPVHVFNVDIKDNHEEALVGGRAILELADGLNAAANEERDAWVGGGGSANGFEAGRAGARSGFDERVPEILAEWQDRWPQLPALWTLAWF